MEKLYILGIGPGNPQEMTRQAFSILERCDLIVGYTRYNDLLKKWFPSKEYFETPMHREQERCEYALKAAEEGKKTVLVCSGDSGVYGMASLTLELAEKRKSPVEIEAVAGVSAVLSAGARLGAPVSGDFAVISLSDLLTPWEIIEKRLRTAAEGDFVLALYNPGSGRRREHLRRACRIIRRSRSGDTVCALAERIGRDGERTKILTLAELEHAKVDMFTTVLVGNSSTRIVHTAAGERLVTPRGYRIAEKKTETVSEPLRSREGEKDRGKKRLLIFGGTTEGRLLAEYACEAGISALVCVATEYGGEILSAHPLLQVDARGLSAEEIEGLLRQEEFLAVMDATHPYASEITEKVEAACSRTRQQYIRVLRQDAGACGQISGASGEEDGEEGVLFVDSIREAAEVLDREEGRALITTGSREIGEYAAVHRAKERLLFRVLPSRESLEACLEAGFAGKNIVCMQGPFSEEANRVLLGDFGAEFLVTKMSGKNGGFSEKLAAARSAGAKVIAVRPPQDRQGISLREAMDRIDQMSAAAVKESGKERDAAAPAGVTATTETAADREDAECGRKGTAAIIGAGPGNMEMLTLKAVRAIREADMIFGAGRLLQDLRECPYFGGPAGKSGGISDGGFAGKPAGEYDEGSGGGSAGDLRHKILTEEYRPEKIAEHIRTDLEKYSNIDPRKIRRYAVIVSGDSGFFSGASKIRRALESEGISVDVLAGVSSAAYLSARTGIPWQDAAFISAHGREISIASAVRSHRKLFVLTGPDVSSLIRSLVTYGLGGVRIFAGERLSYHDERISEGTAAEFEDRSFDPLTVLLILNPDAQACVPPGLPDSRIQRGKVPMTKREVRAVTMSYLGVKEDSIVLDIGAGTGSVTLEAALTARRGHVYAVEKNPEAADLIEKNCRSFAADNVTVIRGSAPDVLLSEDSGRTGGGSACEKSFPAVWAPDIVFIGGAGGKLEKILDALQNLRKTEPDECRGEKREQSTKLRRKADFGAGDRSCSEKMRVVINAVTVETVGAAFRLLSQRGAENLSAVQISAAKTRKAGSHHLLEGQNPVFIISADLGGGMPKKAEDGGREE